MFNHNPDKPEKFQMKFKVLKVKDCTGGAIYL